VLAGAALINQFAVHAAEPPSIQNVRYTENYTYLGTANPAAKQVLAPWASLKYIPLNQSSNIYLTLGAELRFRYERYDENNWGEGPQDDDGYWWARALPLADLHVSENVRIFGQLISAFAYDLDVPRSPVDEDRADVLQGFADVRLRYGADGESSVTLRAGRQLLTYGSGRLMDVRYGPNVLQTFDAAKAFLESGAWRVEAFYARPTDHRPGEFDDRTDESQSIWSLYGTLDPRNTPVGLDVYYIGYENKDAVFNAVSGRELRHTLGTRLFGAARQWDWNYEAFYQFGGFDTKGMDGDISAWSVASDTGFTFERVSLRPRIALKANIISGDRNRNDPDVETFNPHFPKGKYFGELSPIGPANLIHLNPYATLQLSDRLQLSANLAFYWRESTDDGIYAFGGMDLLRANNQSNARFIGKQAELLLEYQMNRNFSATASYSIFTAGQFIKETGPHDTIHLFAMELLYRF
jgi:hypothetical protein